jgi:hypothetical protein
MSRRFVPSLSRSAALLAGALLFASPLAAQDSAAAAPKGKGKWSGKFISLAGIRGTAEIRVENRGDKESRARLTVSSAPMNRQLAWDIVAGSCGDEGRVIAPAAAFRVMLTRNDGSGDAMGTVPRLEAGKRYYARIFEQGQSPTDRNAYGCTNLSEEA